jgi:uncharacterized protein YjaG (DUF416 family)
MFRYDEKLLVLRLSRLPHALRAAFAGLCADRLFPRYEEYAEDNVKNLEEAARLLEDLWNAIAHGRAQKDLQDALARCMALLPPDDSDSAGAEDAISALAYAFRALLTGESQEAAYAARCAYEIVDHDVTADDDVDLSSGEAEEEILVDPRIQTELATQDAQLRALEDLAGVPDFALRVMSLRTREV